jgi:predicted Fe-S protein YdhL (DUF1289 family)
MAKSGEGLWMSANERDRLKVLHEVKKRYITQKQAAGKSSLQREDAGNQQKIMNEVATGL